MPTLPNYKLRFDDPELEGVEVEMDRLTIDELFDFNDILVLPRTNRDESRKYWDTLRGFVGVHMVAWNVTDKRGKKLPPGDVADLKLLEAIRDGWLQGLNGGRAPLAQQLDRPEQEADLADLMQEPGEPPAPSSDDATEPDSSSTP